MAVSTDNIRILISMPKDTKLKIEEKAKLENRSVSNYILTLILKDLESGN